MYDKNICEIIFNKRNSGQSYKRIADDLGMKKCTIQSILTRRKTGTHKKVGRKSIIVKSQKLKMKRQISTMYDADEKITSSKLKDNCDLPGTLRTVQRCLASMKYKYSKIPQRITLNASQKAKRVSILTNWISMSIDWKRTIFTDEKRFSLNGPDNFMTYRRSISNKKSRMKNHSGGGSIMYWGMLLPDCSLYLKEILGNLNADKYIDLLKDYAVPIIMEKMGSHFILQQDNCSCHTSVKTKKYFDEEDISILSWPSYSPDLNLIENMWKIISDHVYDKKQPKNKESLRNLIVEAVREINMSKVCVMTELFDSIGRRISQVLQKRGGLSKY